MLQWMDTGQPFDLEFITADKRKDEGGEWKKIVQGRKRMQLGVKSLESGVRHLQVHKNPHHYENSTRNIVLQNGELRKVHIRLIRRFNGKTVI